MCHGSRTVTVVVWHCGWWLRRAGVYTLWPGQSKPHSFCLDNYPNKSPKEIMVNFYT